MNRGGKRLGAGRPTKWREGTKRDDTKTVRIPKRILNEVLQYAHKLDNNCLTQSKDIDIEWLEKFKQKILKAVGGSKTSKTRQRVEKVLDEEIERFLKND